MQYQKLTNLLDSTSIQKLKNRTKNWIEIIENTKLEVFDVLTKSKFKTTVVGSSL